jgi:hypothetical protein
MEQHAKAQSRPSATHFAGGPFSSQVAATSSAVAAADQAQLLAAIHGVRWKRRGFLQTLARRPRLRSARGL